MKQPEKITHLTFIVASRFGNFLSKETSPLKNRKLFISDSLIKLLAEKNHKTLTKLHDKVFKTNKTNFD